MSLILIVSIIIRLFAMGWSIVLLRRMRDWRMGFLTVMLGLMAMRQTLTLLSEKESWTISVTVQTTELPGLAVSIMAILTVFFLERIIIAWKRTEQVLQESEERYRSLTNDVLDSSEVGIFILDSDFKVVWVNQSLERYFALQRDDIIGKDKRQLIRERIKNIFEDPESFAEKVLATYDDNTYIENFECHVLPGEGREEYWLEHWSQPIQTGLFAGGRIEHYYNITERKRADEALRERELMVQSLIAHAPFSVWMCNGEGTIIYANQAALDLFGVTDPSQIVGRYNIYSHTTEAEKSLLAHFERAWAGEVVHFRQDLDMTTVKYDTSHQETLYFHTTLFTIPASEGQRPNMVVIQEDVTEKVRAEKHIQHLQSVLMAIRNIDQLIVHEKNQKKLLQGACEIINQTRNYKLVWIGLVQEDTKDILPAAQAGFVENYLESVKTIWDDSETGRGPTGTAIKTQKPFVIRDITGDPRYKPWREEAMKYGYVSSAAIPLVYKNRVFGALNVYATIPDAFDEEEINLLLEVSQDIAFALYNIELEEKRKRAEAEHRKSEARLATILDIAADAIIMADEDQRIIHFNQGAEKIFGYRAEEVLGKSIDMLLPPRFVKIHRQHIRAFAIGPQMTRRMGKRSQEVFGYRKDGSVFPADASISKLALEDGTTFTVILRDITKLKRAEEVLRKAHAELEKKVEERTRELAQANTRLKELDRLKSEFIATMSHELRTPLNSIIGFTGIILKGIAGQINEEQRKQLSMVYNSAKHLLSLINDILDLSRIESDRMEISVEKFKIEEVISEVIHTLYPMISQKGLQLITEIQDEIPELQNDRKKIFQILLNLVNNSVKFTSKGEIKIKCYTENNDLVVSVSDTGIGIKKENMAYLFEAFRQIDGTSQRRYQGAGLGLYLCKKLVILLGGEIWAQSEYGKGSQFTFKLPLRIERGDQHKKEDIDRRG